MSEHKVVDLEVKDGKLIVGVDPNKDGEHVVDLELVMNEAIGEAFARQDAIPGAKLVSVGFEDGKLSLKLDTDKDGEMLLALKVDLSEVFDEINDAFSKDDEPADA